MKVPAHPALATESVNYVGDHVAIVIAETLADAKSAADMVKVDYKVLKLHGIEVCSMVGSHQGILNYNLWVYNR